MKISGATEITNPTADAVFAVINDVGGTEVDGYIQFKTLNTSPLVIKKTETQNVNNSTTLVSDDQLVLPLLANSWYLVEGYLRIDTTSGADFKTSFTLPTAGGRRTTFNFDGTATNISFDNWTATVAALQSVSTETYVAIVGHVQTSGAESLTLQWAQNTATVYDTKVLVGSYLKATRQQATS